ncbi:MAG: CDGSH iron-sulfur domain-containing protein [Microgenomates group bacterium]|jgi:CDGSH-type Zn-finger protein
MKNNKVVISKDGPYLVFGNLPLDKQIIMPDQDGIPYKYKQVEKFKTEKEYSLCRCGKSKNKPFCDGSHKKGFNGACAASREKYLAQAEMLEGPGIDLSDASSFCADAAFCDRAGGTWELTKNSENAASRELVIEQCGNCPSGRLVAWDKKTGKAIEPKFKMEISLIEDASSKVSGPVWVKGGVQVELENGDKYEIRNRQTLCRCGKSKNKPFCDGSHIDCEFNDGDKSINSK